MKKNTIIQFGTLALALASANSSTAFGQQPTPSPAKAPLEQRVDKLEGDIGQILQILKSQQTQPAAQSVPSASATGDSSPAPSTAKPAVPPTASLKPGAILELWLLKADFAGDAPTGRSIGGMIDQGDYFALTNFTEEPSLANQQSNRIALKWSGFFQVKEAGAYVFTLEWSKPKSVVVKSGRTEAFWTADLSIDQQSVLKGTPTVGRLYDLNTVAFSDSAEVRLEPGYYPLSLLTFISASDELPATGWDYAKMNLTLKVRGPSDMTPRQISSKELFHKE